VFSNYWEFTGGVQDWVDRGLGSGKSLNLFYTDSTLKGHFKAWMKHIITRRNTVSGVLYAEDPTIMAWELMNEPRLEKQSPPGTVICDWVWEMAEFIKSLDKNHLVCTGDEGFLNDPDAQEPNSWIDNGYEGVDYWCNIQSPDVDFATIHAYPDQWGMKPPDGYTWLADNFFKRRAQLAHSLGKPIILEEYGQAKNFYGDRDTLLGWIHKQANDNQFGCTLVWAVTTRGSDGTVFGKDDQGYVFLYGEDGTIAWRIQVVQMKINMINDTINAMKREQQGP
jgi:mannan endo-1,4-beta-mannosidase